MRVYFLQHCNRIKYTLNNDAIFPKRLCEMPLGKFGLISSGRYLPANILLQVAFLIDPRILAPSFQPRTSPEF